MTTHKLPAHVADAFAHQANASRDLGSPLTAALCALVAEHGLPDSETRRRIATWPGLETSRGDVVPLRFAGALHRLVLDGAEPALVAAYPPNPLDTDALHAAMTKAVTAHDGFVADYLDLPPQTNEVARAAHLLPALLQLAARTALPMRIMELGASAGLLQNFEKFRYDYGRFSWGDPASPLTIGCEWRGDAPFPAGELPPIAERGGCDIAPVSIATDDDRKRLQSYVWPDQPHRFQRLTAAMAIALDHPPAIDEAGAADWLETRLAPLPAGRHTIVMHAIMWQYVPADEKARAEAAIRHAGRQATPDAPLSWVRFEADGDRPGGGVRATHWSGAADDGISRLVARGDYHGRWVEPIV
ncbi:MAG: DUF2332 family protein [Phyllobacteriaceae bacterium]|jgi:hypothetical protein|nr:DUF2332 family protein [Phyllobacteriaceae bacterium]